MQSVQYDIQLYLDDIPFSEVVVVMKIIDLQLMIIHHETVGQYLWSVHITKHMRYVQDR